MVKNKTRQKPVNAWVSLCLVTKRLANWGELLSDRPLVRTQPGVPKAPLQAIFCWFAAFFCFASPGLLLVWDRENFMCCNVYPAKKKRTISTFLLRKIPSLLIGVFGLTCRLVPPRAAQPGYLPVPATAGAVPPGPPGQASPVPVPSAPLGDGPRAGWDLRRRRSQTSGR